MHWTAEYIVHSVSAYYVDWDTILVFTLRGVISEQKSRSE